VEFLNGWLAVVTLFALADGGAGGQAAERGGDVWTHLAGVIEGEYPVERGEGEKFRF
jgi:hypothetical protein